MFHRVRQVREQFLDNLVVNWREHQMETVGIGIAIQVPAPLVHHVGHRVKINSVAS
jgi:hypothetical protein